MPTLIKPLAKSLLWSMLLMSIARLGSSFAHAQVVGALANPNPNNYDNAKIMQVIRNPGNDVVLAAHRGLHALAGTQQAIKVPENSLQAIGAAAQAGWESIEIDIKLTSDGVPILSHDQTWGREWCGKADLLNGGKPYDPFIPPGNSVNDQPNRPVGATSLSNTRSWFGGTTLRDSVTLVTDTRAHGCTDTSFYTGEYPPTLADVYSYIRNNHIQMVVTLDLRDAATAKASWDVVKQATDDRGRTATSWTIYKMPALAFSNVSQFQTTFGDYWNVKFNPVFHTANVAPQQANASEIEQNDINDSTATSFGSEYAMVNWIKDFQNLPGGTPRVDLISIEVTMKEPSSVQDGGILSFLRDWVTSQGYPISSFQTVPEYVADSRGQYFYAANGSCCFFKEHYLYNWPDQKGSPLGVPYDHADHRDDANFLVTDNIVRMATTDRPDLFATYLINNGRRHISRYAADGTTPGIASSLVPAPLTLSTSSQSVTSSDTVTLTASIFPLNAAGTLSLLENGSSISTAGISSATATFSLSSLSEGTHTYTAVYGDPSTPNIIKSNSVTVTVSASAAAADNNPPNGADPLPALTVGETTIRRPDPSVILVNGTYYSVESSDGAGSGPAKIFVRSASSLAGLQNTNGIAIFTDSQKLGEVWAPEIMNINGLYYVYFSMGSGSSHRMYVISSSNPSNGYGAAMKLALPDDRWAIDGTIFTFKGQQYFVWSGWAGTTNVEQDLYIAKMSNPTTPTGSRYVISQAREPFERVVGNPYINEAPEAIVDPNGQLHVVYSTNGSWSSEYCLGDLRLRAGGDPTYVWDWYKSAGCLFGSDGGNMEPNGWYPALYTQGPGHHTFALRNGDINNSPNAAYPNTASIMYAGVPNGMTYKWANRTRYVGAFTWYNNINYNRCCVPGNNVDTGYTPMFFEDPAFKPHPPPAGPPAGTPGYTGIRNADPSVIRQGGTYISVEVASDATTIMVRQASTPGGLSNVTPYSLANLSKDVRHFSQVWSPKLQIIANVYYIYFSALTSTDTTQRHMYVLAFNDISGKATQGTSGPVSLPDNNWATDGSSFIFNNQRYFVWSGWPGSGNVEQALYIAKMSDPSTTTGAKYIISEPKETWELKAGGGNGYPSVNEAPAAIIDPNRQLHVFYSANGSWSSEYCIADLRLRAGGDPTYVWDWYKSNGCEFTSDSATARPGWDATKFVDGPGSHSFVLENGDVATSPPAGPVFPSMYTAVPKGTTYNWANRMWFNGSFQWWNNTTYSRSNVPGATSDTGFALKFYEGPTAPQ